MSYNATFTVLPPHSSFDASTYTVTATPLIINLDVINIDTAVRLYRGLKYEYITSGDDAAVKTKLITIINEISSGSGGGSGSGGISTVQNIGAGFGIYKETIAGTAKLKSVTAGSYITIADTGEELVINAQAQPVIIPIESVSNASTGDASIFKSLIGKDASFRRITAGNNVSVTQNTDEVIINAIIPPIPTQGITSVQSVGSLTGISLVKDILSSTVLRMRKLVNGNNISITESGDDIIINAVIPPSTAIQDVTNISSGAAQPILKQVTGQVAQLRGIKEGNNVNITLDGEDIVISAVPGEGAEFATGTNLGSGTGSVYKNTTGSSLNFRTLKAGTNVTITEDANEVTITASVDGSTFGVQNLASDGTSGSEAITKTVVGDTAHFKGIKAGSNISVTGTINDLIISSSYVAMETGSNDGGAGNGQVFKNLIGNVGHFRSLKAGTNISITQDADEVTINAGGGSSGVSGVINDGLMSNAAIGVGVTGSDLHLRSLRAGSGITLTQNVDEVVIDAVAGFGGITGVSNDDGGGSVDGQIFKNIVSGVAHLRTVKAGSNVSITQDADTITISSTAGSGGGSSNTFSNVGLGSGVYRDISGSNVNLRSIAAGSGISVTENANEIVISTTGGSGGGGTASGFNEYNNGSVYSAGQIITKDGTIYRAKTSTSTSFEYEEWDNLSDPSHDKNVESKGTRLSTALTIGNYYDVNFGIGNAFKDAGTEVILWPDRDGERALAAGQVCVFRKPRVYGHEYSDDAPNIQDYGSGGL